MFVLLLFLFCWVTWAVANSITLPTTVELDLVFPLNETYAPIDPFPVIFVIQNAAAAWSFGLEFTWNITGVIDGDSGQETFPGDTIFLLSNNIRPNNLLPPSDPFIIVNSTDWPGASVAVTKVPAGKWALGWSYSIPTTCTPTADGEFLTIRPALPIQGSMSFTVKDGGASPVFTRNCSTLAGQFGIVANWTGCPQLGGTPGIANPCGAKIDTVQASSISAALATTLGTLTSSATGGSLSSSATSTSTMGSSIINNSPKATNIAVRAQLGSTLLSAAASIAGLGIFLL
ncbi:hypothetical protein DL95DRAFT_500531 [Leptodontidium sp. 2 PMI_412]|nr:hypothetical protein DL95DRAFT_500531 [Leptodontidium sp. 2 PMI_412]